MGTQGRAAIYCRISKDTEGQELGVARQEEDCRALAQREGLTVAAVYIDNDTGASTRSRSKSRPQFDAMLAAAESGDFGVVLSYSSSRLTRRPLELERLVSLHEQTGVRFRTVVSGSDDLSTADGRQMARIRASVDAGEVERTAERVARKHLENAQAGRPVGGTRPFGWRDDKVTLDAGEADLIRQAAKDVINGAPIRSIVSRWNAAGVTTSTGKPWSRQTLRQMLRSPRLAGWRIHQGKVATGKDGEPVRGKWEPVLDQPTFDALQAALTATPDVRSRVPRRGARHYLLTGLVRCGVCNGLMYGNAYSADRHYYRCEKGHNSVSGHSTDALITEVVLAWAESVTVEQPAAQFTGMARLAEVTARIDDLMEAFTAGILSAAAAFPAVKRLEADRAELEKQRADVAVANLRRPGILSLNRQTWEAADVDRRRAFTETALEAVLVKPATRRGNSFDANRVVPVWRGTE